VRPYPVFAPVLAAANQFEFLLKQRMVRVNHTEDEFAMSLCGAFEYSLERRCGTLGPIGQRRVLVESLRRRRARDFLDKGNDNRRACSLYLSIMDRMDVKLDRFGDADKRLPEVFA
jgi:hypothetical protein